MANDASRASGRKSVQATEKPAVAHRMRGFCRRHHPLVSTVLLALTLAFAGCSSTGSSGRKALLGIPLPGIGPKPLANDSDFQKKVQKDPFPSAGPSMAVKGTGG
jgi:hypothetical protein